MGKSHESLVSSPFMEQQSHEIESVNEACRDAAWGERREIGRTGLALHIIYSGDLIEEIVKEMGFDCIYQLRTSTILNHISEFKEAFSLFDKDGDGMFLDLSFALVSWGIVAFALCLFA
ncbi:hypothetical protein NC652_015235 [Populus alba x Populus x berolinensis]|nr:hypothetical protein NC652_015235 [Populus alba x Populus x berolinensis]